MQLNTNIWEKKYKAANDGSPEDTFKRVATAAASVESGSDSDKESWQRLFTAEMESLRFLPGGRILASGGTGKPKATLSNCFVMSPPEDSMAGIMDSLKDGALTMQSGGGIGINFSGLRPYGATVGGTGSIASGPVSFMHMWNAMSVNISGVGDRKGAMIAVLNCDHPDIMGFITAKDKNSKDHKVLEKFNISVGITNAFINAVKSDTDWALTFEGKIFNTIRARDLWDHIMSNAHKKAEPGILFLDRINEAANLWYAEHISATNPCGEQPLAPNGSCNLGAINLTKFVQHPFTEKAAFNYETFTETVQHAVRFMDNILDVNYYPLQPQRDDAMEKRKIGLGIMGLGSVLAMLRIRYGTEESIKAVNEIMGALRDTAYAYSVELAKEKGAFPLLDKEKYLQGAFIRELPESVKESIKEHGIRNANILTIAPTGSIAQLAGNVTSGVEPMFCIEYSRSNYGEDIAIKDPTFQLYCDTFEAIPADKAPSYFVDAHTLTPEEHLKVMAACQKFIDSSISKTINLPKEISVKEMEHVYLLAYDLGCKGCTVYREGSLDEEVLRKKDSQKPSGKGSNLSYELDGRRYKVKIPDSKHAFYLNFSHSTEDSGRRRPIELFLNTKDPAVEEWTKAIGRLISAVFRNVEDPTFLAEEMKEVYAQSGFWSAHRKMYVPSLVAEFGHVMHDYFVHLGLIDPDVPFELYEDPGNGAPDADKKRVENRMGYCRKCGQHSVIFQEGCPKCINPSCLFTRCG